MYNFDVSSPPTSMPNSDGAETELRSRIQQLEELMFSQQKRLDMQQDEIELQRREINKLKQVVIIDQEDNDTHLANSMNHQYYKNKTTTDQEPLSALESNGANNVNNCCEVSYKSCNCKSNYTNNNYNQNNSVYHMNPLVHPSSAIPPVTNVSSQLPNWSAHTITKRPTSAVYQQHHLIRKQYLDPSIAKTNELETNPTVVIKHRHLDERDLVGGLDSDSGSGSASSACRMSHSRQRFVETRFSKQSLADLDDFGLISAPQSCLPNHCGDELCEIGFLARKEEILEQMIEKEAMENEMPHSYITFNKFEVHELERHLELERQSRYRPKKAKLTGLASCLQCETSTASNEFEPAQATRCPTNPAPILSSSSANTDEPAAVIPQSLREIITKLPF